MRESLGPSKAEGGGSNWGIGGGREKGISHWDRGVGGVA